MSEYCLPTSIPMRLMRRLRHHHRLVTLGRRPVRTFSWTALEEAQASTASCRAAATCMYGADADASASASTPGRRTKLVRAKASPQYNPGQDKKNLSCCSSLEILEMLFVSSHRSVLAEQWLHVCHCLVNISVIHLSNSPPTSPSVFFIPVGDPRAARRRLQRRTFLVFFSSLPVLALIFGAQRSSGPYYD